MTNIENYVYSTPVYFGSHRQQLDLIVDSGSSVMWVQSEECHRLSECTNSHPYASQNSQSFKRSGMQSAIQYGIGRVEGELATDQVSFFEDPLPVQVSQNFQFLFVTKSSGLTTLGADGLLGLAPGAVTPDTKTVLQ